MKLQQIFSNQIVDIVIVEEKEGRRNTPLAVKNGGKISKNENQSKAKKSVQVYDSAVCLFLYKWESVVLVLFSCTGKVTEFMGGTFIVEQLNLMRPEA